MQKLFGYGSVTYLLDSMDRKHDDKKNHSCSIYSVSTLYFSIFKELTIK